MTEPIQDYRCTGRVAHQRDSASVDGGPIPHHVKGRLDVVVFLFATGELALAVPNAPKVEPEGSHPFADRRLAHRCHYGIVHVSAQHRVRMARDYSGNPFRSRVLRRSDYPLEFELLAVETYGRLSHGYRFSQVVKKRDAMSPTSDSDPLKKWSAPLMTSASHGSA